MFEKRMENIGSYLSATSEFAVICRLNEAGLLHEDSRRRVVANVSKLAVITPDADWLSEDLLFADGEREAIMERVKKELVPSIHSVISDWRSDYDPRHGAQAFMDPLRDALRRYRNYFQKR